MSEIPKEDPDKGTAIIFGYMPLVYSSILDSDNLVENPTEDQMKSLVGKVDSGENIETKAVGFVSNPETHELTIVVIVEHKSKEIVEHLKWYSEQKPEEWFKIYFTDNDNAYACLLSVNYDKVISRMRLKMPSGHADDKFMITSRYFGTVCPIANSTYQLVREHLKTGEKVLVALADIADIAAGKFGEEFLFRIGELEIGSSNGDLKPILDNLLSEYEKNSSPKAEG